MRDFALGGESLTSLYRMIRVSAHVLTRMLEVKRFHLCWQKITFYLKSTFSLIILARTVEIRRDFACIMDFRAVGETRLFASRLLAAIPFCSLFSDAQSYSLFRN